MFLHSYEINGIDIHLWYRFGNTILNHMIQIVNKRRKEYTLSVGQGKINVHT